jgi:hypothetical protein
VRLIDSAVGCIVWSEQFDYRAVYAIALQEQLAITISQALEQYFSRGQGGSVTPCYGNDTDVEGAGALQ